MKVGILTFHEIYNPGAFLQAMGTVSLVKALGHDPVIIDYTPPAHRYSVTGTLKNWRLWRHPVFLAEMYGRNQAFQRAQADFSKTRKLLTHAELEKESFDAVLIGADIVWDYLTSRLGSDSVYFGAHLNAEKIISFAASCGCVPNENIPPDFVIEGLKKMSSISVRDQNTQRMVQRHAHRDSVIICDPAFHLDAVEWAIPPKRQDRYLLVYAMPQFVNREMISQTKSYARMHGLKTIAVCYRQKWTDENHICIGPMEWLGYIQNAAAVVTNTFHGTVFSVKAGVPFASSLNDAIRLKAATMIEKLGIEGQFLNSKKTVGEILDEPWAVEPVHGHITQWRNEAGGFLQRALDA